MITWIENWFTEQCNGDWEHDQVISIESLDNPGWCVKIDFNYTDVNVENIEWKVFEFSEKDWIGYKVIDNVFHSSGDSLKLNICLKIFKYLIENKKLDLVEKDILELKS